jgi:hypothetical protein
MLFMFCHVPDTRVLLMKPTTMRMKQGVFTATLHTTAKRGSMRPSRNLNQPRREKPQPEPSNSPLVRYRWDSPVVAAARKRIGEAWHPKAAADGVSQVFISPTLVDPVRCLDVLAHELIHVVHPDAGHKAPFKRLALAIGLTGKMTATVAGPELEAHLKAIADTLGAYPHAQLNLSAKKKQSTRLIKAACPGCTYTVRLSQKWIDEAGAPYCPMPLCRDEDTQMIAHAADDGEGGRRCVRRVRAPRSRMTALAVLHLTLILIAAWEHIQ